MNQDHFESLYPDNARFREIQMLSEYIKNGASSQLLSIPGAGRGTILGLLANNKKVRIKHFGDAHKLTHFVAVNFSEIRGKSLHDTTKFIFLSLCDSLRARQMDDDYKKVNGMLKESLGFKDEMVLFQALKEAIDYLALEKKLKIVLLFDRFEEYVPVVKSEFFSNLNILRNRAKYQFLVVFSLSRPLEEILDPSIVADFYEFVVGNNVYVGLEDNVTTDFRVAYIEKITAKKLNPVIFENIIDATGGVGKLVKLSVEAVLSKSFNGDVPDLIEFLISQKSIQNALTDICRSLTPAEQKALITEDFKDEIILSYLQCIGLLKEKSIQIPLFEQHIRTHKTQNQISSSQIIFDPSANTISKGDSALSDQLTQSEFKLLKFLLQNNDRVIERDELINVVWSDVKSTAGITDQAVDQLIFRLRRKIEEDPNNPTHLMTVKGRGFKFLP